MAEYGLLIALVLIVAVATLGLFGDSIFSVFDSTNNGLEDAAPLAP